MKDDDFRELMSSIEEGKAILAGECEPLRRFVVESRDVRRIRERLAVSQNAFANLMGVSVNTVQNWEQGRRVPTGPARVLLSIVQNKPGILSEPWFASGRGNTTSRSRKRETLSFA